MIQRNDRAKLNNTFINFRDDCFNHMIVPPLTQIERASKSVKGSHGEYLVLQRLGEIARNQGWLILRNFRVEHHQSKIESEIDVVLFAGQLGIILLEVKGSSVRVTDGSWYVFNRGAQKWEIIQDPLEQIKDNMFAFREAVSPVLHQFRAYPMVSWAAVFPESDAVQGTLSYPSWRICSGSKLDALEVFIENLVKKERSKLSNLKRKMVGGIDIRTAHAVVSKLVPTDVAEVEVGPEYNNVLNELERETRYVKDIMDSIEAASFCITEGAAGTGKTKAAMHVSRACISRGDAVLFLASSQSFCNHIGNILGGMYPGRGEVWCSSLEEALPVLSDVQLLVVDEAQDIVHRADVQLALRQAWKAQIPVRIFGDFEGQNLYKSRDTFHDWLRSQHIVWLPVKFQRNCRNTEVIGQTLKAFHHGDSSALSFTSIRGEKIEVVPPVLRSHLGSAIANKVDEWVAGGYPIGGVTVLYTLDGSGHELGAETLELFGGRPVGEINLSEDVTIPVSSILNFKGLESPCIILVLDAIDSSMDKALYIAFSRARLKVYVILTESVNVGQIPDFTWKIAGKN